MSGLRDADLSAPPLAGRYRLRLVDLRRPAGAGSPEAGVDGQAERVTAALCDAPVGLLPA